MDGKQMSMQTIIEQKLAGEIAVDYLQVENESHMHNVAPGSESHFKVTIVSESFVGKRLLACHRMVNEVLSEELANDIHALAIHTYTAEKWGNVAIIPTSPNCMGGSGK